jgi:hypothetical protein
LFRTPALRRNTLVGTGLAAIGMATFWGVHVYGKDLVREEITAYYLSVDLSPLAATDDAREAVLAQRQAPIQRWEMLGMFLVTTGGGLGLLAFAPITGWTNRRKAFLFYHLGGFLITLITFQAARGLIPTLVLLPLFGFLTLGMHAGYAIYFPELFPTRLRGSGNGFCFNVGRVLAAPVLVLGGALQKAPFNLSLRTAVPLLSGLFLIGAGLLLVAPETKDQPLPE